MKNFAKVLLAIASMAVGAAVAYAIKEALCSQAVELPQPEIKQKDTLTLAEIREYFKSLILNPLMDTPFLCTDLSHFNFKPAVLPKVGEKAILVGVYDESSKKIRDYVLVYSKSFDEELNTVMSHAKDGLVTLS